MTRYRATAEGDIPFTPQEEADRDAEEAAWANSALTRARDGLIRQIDVDVDAIYAATVGNRQSEYELAEADATAYKDAGYTGTVPASVQVWATVKNWTAQTSADDILATAAAWRTAQAAIRLARLQRKEGARTAADLSALDTVKAQWAGFVAAIRGQLGL